MNNARKAEQRLKVFMQQFPKSPLRPEVEIRLREVQENLAMHDYNVGNHYRERYYRRVASNLKGAQSRFKDIADKYPHFSRMAEVLYRLGETYVTEEEPDEAAKYFQRLVRNYPNCGEFVERAREQLAAIGSSIPEPDPKEANKPCDPQSKGLMGTLWQEITGAVQKTVDKNGVIISNGGDKNDLIQKVIENEGSLPDNFNTLPVERTAPGRRLTAEDPAKKPAPAKKDVSTEPAQPKPTAQPTPANASTGTSGAKP
jgi:tetratricopeptide (TPR) repeat protein